MSPARHRPTYLLLVVLTIILGLVSRMTFIPDAIYPYLGDVLYTVLWVWLGGLCFPRIKGILLVTGAIAGCFLIEISQLYQADWLNEIRSYRLGGLVLGYHFLWSDWVCYTLGGMLAGGLDAWIYPDSSYFSWKE